MTTYESSFPSASYGSHPELRLNRRLDLRWASIFGGSLLGWGLLFFLSLLGLTIGLAAIEPYSSRPASGLDTGSGIWAIAALALSSAVGAFFGVCIAGERRKREAILHGAVSWGLSMVAGGLLAFSAGSTAAKPAADNPPRTSARVDGNGNVRMSRADRERLDGTKSSAAKAAGVAAGSAMLSLLAALLGAGLGAAAVSGKRFHLGRKQDQSRDRELGQTSSAGMALSTDAADRDLLDRDRP